MSDKKETDYERAAKHNAMEYCKTNGLVMVPEEPTEDMINTGLDMLFENGAENLDDEDPRECYKVMIKAFKEQAK